MAARVTFLIALLAAAGCLRSPAPAARECRACHASHYVREGGCRECHRGSADERRLELAHARLLTGAAAAHRLPGSRALREGGALVVSLACRRCHTIGGEGNALATRLDPVVWRREQAELVASIRSPVPSMPRFGLSTEQSEALVAFLLRSGDPAGAQDAYRVHFDDAGSSASTFERTCGGCHRVLTPRGPLGSGNAGPNLSGLFTAHYPRTAPGQKAWTAQALRSWLANPRSQRRQTTMPPIVLEAKELRWLLLELEEAPTEVGRP